MAETHIQSGGVGFGGLLFIVFLTLKLTHVIAWSWWWITAPLWIPFVFIGVALILTGAFFFLDALLNRK